MSDEKKTEVTDIVLSSEATELEVQRQTAALQRRGPFDAVFESGSWQHMRQACATLARSGMVPTDCRARNPQDVERATDTIMARVQYGMELGFGVMQSLQNIDDINGRPGVFGDAAIALVYGSGLLEAYHEELDEETMIATAKAKRRGIADPFVVSFSKADAEQAKLWGRKGPWTEYPKRMLVFRARSWCLRNGFADVLKGIGLVEELRDIPPDTVSFTQFGQGEQGDRQAYHQMQGEIIAAIRAAANLAELDAAVMPAASLPSDMQDKLRKAYRQKKESLRQSAPAAKPLPEGEKSQKTQSGPAANRETSEKRELLAAEFRTVFGEVMSPDVEPANWFAEVFEKPLAEATLDDLEGAIKDIVEMDLNKGGAQ